MEWVMVMPLHDDVDLECDTFAFAKIPTAPDRVYLFCLDL